jgi:GNAT superfamily N-acetyltransferase
VSLPAAGPSGDITIRPAASDDVPLVLNFIRKLAEYEQMSHRVAATEEALHDALFGERSFVEVLLAFSGDNPAGFALFFPTFSTFACRRGIYLEDFFVEPAHRRKGVGTMLLAAVARIAHAHGGQMNWSVLKWNQPAIDFYKRLGAVEIDTWSGWKLSGDSLARLAGTQ